MFSALYQFDVGNYKRSTPGSNIISVTSTAAGDFDKANLTNDVLRQVWRSTGVLGWQEIIIEADQTTAIDTFAILNHNFSETAVINLQANIGNNFLAPPVNLFLPWNKLHIVYTTPLGASYKFYKIRILDPSNPCGYIQIGRIVGGRALIMQNNEDITDDVQVQWKDFAKRMDTEGFFRASNENVKIRTLAVKFSKLYTVATKNANYLALRDLFDYCGVTRPFLAIPNRDEPSFNSIWGQIEDIPDDSFGINQFVSLNLKVREVY